MHYFVVVFPAGVFDCLYLVANRVWYVYYVYYLYFSGIMLVSRIIPEILNNSTWSLNASFCVTRFSHL